MELSKARAGKYTLLRQKKYRSKEGLFLVQGEKAVIDTFPFFEAEAVIVRKGYTPPFEVDNYILFETTEPIINKISSLEDTPDIIAVYKQKKIAGDLKVEKNSFAIVLDGVQDPGNLGTIIRTAHWFGITKIFCSPDTVDVYNPKVVMATMGSVAKVEVVYCELEHLFNQNPCIPVYGLLLKGKNIYDTTVYTPGFIVMGSEGHGVRLKTALHITEGLTIPPKYSANRPESLNVAVATAIALSQLVK